MMYCLRSYIPLLLLPLPLSLSPIHLTLLLALTYILNRPCIYCSLLLLILFASSCHWSGRCFVDFSYKSASQGGTGMIEWFIPRLYTAGRQGLGNVTAATVPTPDGDDITVFLTEVAGSTVTALASAVTQGLKNKVAGMGALETVENSMSMRVANDTGIGLGWIKSLLGKSEWTLPCTKFKVAL